MQRICLSTLFLLTTACGSESRDWNNPYDPDCKESCSKSVDPAGGVDGPNSSSSSQYPTSGGGSFWFTDIQKEAAVSNKTIIGFNSFDGSLFRNLRTNGDSGLFTSWVIQKYDYNAKKWNDVCPSYTTSAFQGGLAVDKQYYYVASSNNNSVSGSKYLKRFSTTDCSEAASLDIGEYIIYDGADNFKMAFFDTTLYFSPFFNPWRVKSYNSDTNLVSKITPSTNFQGVTLLSPDALAITKNSTWAVTKQRIWNVSSSGTITAWAELPENDYSQLVNPFGLAFVSSSKLALLASRDGDSFLFFIDISNFK